MIPVSRLHAILDAGHTAAYDLRGDIEALLPSDGLVLSGEEVAQISKSLYAAAALADGYGKPKTEAEFRAALSLLASAGEET